MLSLITLERFGGQRAAPLLRLLGLEPGNETKRDSSPVSPEVVGQNNQGQPLKGRKRATTNQKLRPGSPKTEPVEASLWSNRLCPAHLNQADLPRTPIFLMPLLNLATGRISIWTGDRPQKVEKTELCAFRGNAFHLGLQGNQQDAHIPPTACGFLLKRGTPKILGLLLVSLEKQTKAGFPKRPTSMYPNPPQGASPTLGRCTVRSRTCRSLVTTFGEPQTEGGKGRVHVAVLK